MKITEGKCQCNSGKLANECCYQMEPPITRDPEVQINGITLDSSVQALDAKGSPISRKIPASIRATLKVSDLFVQNDFIYRLVEKAQHDVKTRLYTQSFSGKANEDNAFEDSLIDNLYRNIRAAYYHLQGFIYRFTRLARKFNQNDSDISAGIKVVDEDLPLELEFESFMIRYRTCVELVVKLIAHKITPYNPRLKNQYDFKKTLEYIREHPDNATRIAISEAIKTHEEWLNEQRKIRHAIAHDGMNNTLQNFEHVRGTTLNATILDRTATFMSTQMFNELIDFCSKVIDAIYGVNEQRSNSK